MGTIKSAMLDASYSMQHPKQRRAKLDWEALLRFGSPSDRAKAYYNNKALNGTRDR